jgi:hypothetical protein
MSSANLTRRYAAPSRTGAWRRFAPRLWRQITLRSVLVVAAAAFVLVYPIYTVLEGAISHGIHRHGDLLVVDMKAMSDFNFDQLNGITSDIPAAYRDLDGKRVMLAGEMWAPDTASGRLDRFQLVYSIMRCCFAGPPRVQHFVNATVPASRDVEYHSGVVDVIGTLHVNAEHADGRVASVYRLDVERVE